MQSVPTMKHFLIWDILRTWWSKYLSASHPWRILTQPILNIPHVIYSFIPSRQNVVLNKVKQVRKTLLKAIGIEVRDQKMLSELNPTETKGWTIFKRLIGWILGHLFFFFFFTFYFILEYKQCISFRCTTKWFNYTYTYVYIFFKFFSQLDFYRIWSNFPVLWFLHLHDSR